MKTTLNLKGIQLGDLRIGDIVLEQEYSASEATNLMFGAKRFVKELIKDLPEMLLDLEGAFETFQEIDERQESKVEHKFDGLARHMHSEMSMEDILANLRAQRDAEYARERQAKEQASNDRPMPRVKVKVTGPQGEMDMEDVPAEIKSVIGDIIGKIERGEMR